MGLRVPSKPYHGHNSLRFTDREIATMRCTLLLLGIIALAGCDSDLLRVPEPSIGPQLKGDELKTALRGHSFIALEDQVPPLIVYFDEGGEMMGLRANNYRDKGTWEIKDDTLCGKWENWYGTLSSCWQVHRIGDRVTVRSLGDNPREAAGTLKAGNSIKS